MANTAVMTQEEMSKALAEIEALKKQLAEAKSKARGTLTLRVSDKGALSLYGLQRFPVTLYRDQWLTVLSMADTIKAFIKDNEAALPSKGDS